MLNLAHQSPASWHTARATEEIEELLEAPNRIYRLSETTDVFFAISRAKYDGFPIESIPSFPETFPRSIVYPYMIWKYTARWALYKAVAKFCGGDWKNMREVVNPGKDSKLVEVALRHNIDPVKFVKVGRRIRRVWPLLP